MLWISLLYCFPNFCTVPPDASLTRAISRLADVSYPVSHALMLKTIIISPYISATLDMSLACTDTDLSFAESYTIQSTVKPLFTVPLFTVSLDLPGLLPFSRYFSTQ